MVPLFWQRVASPLSDLEPTVSGSELGVSYNNLLHVMTFQWPVVFLSSVTGNSFNEANPVLYCVLLYLEPDTPDPSLRR